jgi:hypothetical protein
LTVKCARPNWSTQNGQNEYNDQLQFEMTQALEKNWLFNKYQTALQDKGSYTYT